MGLSLPSLYNRKILRAILEFNLIEDGDRVLVGFSGGKDSGFLLYALSVLRQHRIINCDLAALTVDLGFSGGFPMAELAAYCQSLDVPFHTLSTKIGQAALEQRQGPCNICSHLRRGAMNRFAKANGFNKVALAHHHDDAVETFLMCSLYSGQIRTFLPRSELDGSGLVVIRPLVYLREKEIRKTTEFTGFVPVPSPCPYNCQTQRQRVKELIRELTREHRWVYTNLASAMRYGNPIELWPAAPGPERRREMLFKPKR